MSHTPGPWAICGYVVYDVPTGFSVTKLSREHPAQTNSNAHLIAAAPDLLEACEALLVEFHEWEEHRGTHPDADRARAAIKKARGEQ